MQKPERNPINLFELISPFSQCFLVFCSIPQTLLVNWLISYRRLELYRSLFQKETFKDLFDIEILGRDVFPGSK